MNLAEVRRSVTVPDVALMVVCLGACLALKHHYSVASPEGLAWILAPTTAVVSALTGAGFTLDPAIGWVNEELRFAIGPSCAGVNFLIAAFAAAVFGFVGTRRTAAEKVAFVAAAAVAVYVATIAVNALRIVIAIHLHTRHVAIDLFGAGLSGEELHRVEGIAVYFAALCALFLIARHFLAEGSRDPAAA